MHKRKGLASIAASALIRLS
ncbi:hypothetical protein ACSVDA_12660 [Cytobacillus sp. Hm23]